MHVRLLHRHHDADHLEAVMVEMAVLGAPVIKAVDVGNGFYAAIHGCHRIRAAKALGLSPIIEEIPYDDAVVDDVVRDEFPSDPELMVAEVVDRSWDSIEIAFDD